jgi:hypothetical protein
MSAIQDSDDRAERREIFAEAKFRAPELMLLIYSAAIAYRDNGATENQAELLNAAFGDFNHKALKIIGDHVLNLAVAKEAKPVNEG